MNTYNLLTLVIAICALAGVFVWGLGGKAKQSNNDALVQENQSLRNQLSDCHTESEINRTRAEKSEKNEQYLKDLAQSKPDFSKLVEGTNTVASTLATQHAEILNSFDKLIKSVGTLANTIAKDRKDG